MIGLCSTCQEKKAGDNYCILYGLVLFREKTTCKGYGERKKEEEGGEDD